MENMFCGCTNTESKHKLNTHVCVKQTQHIYTYIYIQQIKNNKYIT